MAIPTEIRLRLVALAIVAVVLFTGCTAMPTPTAAPRRSAAQLVKLIATSKEQHLIPKGARIVIGDIQGPCKQEVKDALMKRLVDNAAYNVITRDNLTQIMGETELNWAGKFNTHTAAKLGELMGASLWIVGNISYCGEVPSFGSGSRYGSPVSVFAVFQVIEIETGKVLMASASEGTYVPQALSVPSFKLLRAASQAPAQPGGEPAPSDGAGLPSPTTTSAAPGTPVDPTQMRGGRGKRFRRWMNDLTSRQAAAGPMAESTAGPAISELDVQRTERKRYPLVSAADDMANRFADKFFGRPLWHDAVMWDSPLWAHSRAIRLVQLGHCPRALALIEQVAAQEVSEMNGREVAEYLHNYGVTLLCANQPERAAEKLRSAYRIDAELGSLDMLGLAAKVMEWNLVVQVDQQPEVKLLVENEPLLIGG